MPSASEFNPTAGGVGFDHALTDLVEASKIPAKQRKSKVSGLVDTICSHAYENGLSPDALSTITDIITLSNHLDQGSITAIIKSLYPASKVLNDVVYRVVGSLGQGKGKPSAPTQALLVKWLIMVYEVLVDLSVLSRLYGVLFNMLDMISLRGPLCHLLSLITRRKHVRPFRIQMLLELIRNIASEPALVGFLRVFKDYYPDVIVGDAMAGRASYFSHPDPEWRERLLTIQAVHSRSLQDHQSQQSSFKVVRRGTKRSRVSMLPEVRTARASENSVTLEEIENVDDFVGKIEKIELPNQLISALGDPLFQKYLILKPSETASKRLNEWLLTFFDEELRSVSEGQNESRRLADMLEKLLGYTRYTKVLCSSAEIFLQSYINHWDAISDGHTVLDLLSYLPIRPFNDLQEMFFDLLESAVIDSSVESRVMILNFYTSLLRHWTVRLLDQSSNTAMSNEALSTSFTSLIVHADILCLSILETLPPVLSTISSILSFYETLATSISHAPTNPKIRITTPSSEVIYRLTFTTSLSTLSRLCSVLSTYKTAFEAAMSRTEGNGYPREYVNHFNGFLMDICNCLWRNRALNREDANALGCLVPPTVLPALRTYVDGLGHSLPTLFSLSNSTTLCALAIACFRDLEDAGAEAEDGSLSTRQAGPVTQRSLTVLGSEGGLKISWGNYRLEVLKWLDERGVKGVRELMFNTMKHLMTAKGAGNGI